MKHVKFWTVTGSELTGKKGILTSAGTGVESKKMQTMLCVAFGAVSCLLNVSFKCLKTFGMEKKINLHNLDN